MFTTCYHTLCRNPFVVKKKLEDVCLHKTKSNDALNGSHNSQPQHGICTMPDYARDKSLIFLFTETQKRCTTNSLQVSPTIILKTGINMKCELRIHFIISNIRIDVLDLSVKYAYNVHKTQINNYTTSIFTRELFQYTKLFMRWLYYADGGTNTCTMIGKAQTQEKSVRIHKQIFGFFLLLLGCVTPTSKKGNSSLHFPPVMFCKLAVVYYGKMYRLFTLKNLCLSHTLKALSLPF